jgi:hypothetical protein
MAKDKRVNTAVTWHFDFWAIVTAPKKAIKGQIKKFCFN